MDKRVSENDESSPKRRKAEPYLKATLIRRESDATLDACRRQVFTAIYKLSHNIEDFNHLEQFENDFNDLYRQMLEPLISNCAPEDIIAVRIQDDESLGKSTLTRGDIFVTYKRRAKIDYKELSLKLRKVAQSNTQFLEFGVLKMLVSVVKPFRGGRNPSGRGSKVVSVPSFIISRRSLVQVKTLDCFPNSCGYLALTLGVFFVRNLAHVRGGEARLRNRFKNLRQSPAMLTNAARDLYAEIGLPLNLDQAVGMAELNDIQTALQNEMQIIVFTRPTTDVQRRSVPCTFVGKSEATSKLTLEFDGDMDTVGHYGLVTKPGCYVDAKFFCFECFTGYSRRDVHSCPALCKSCKTKNCQSDEILECSACHMKCNGFDCLERHLQRVCGKFKYCDNCETRYMGNKKNPHKCDYEYCQRCEMEYQGTHFHYLTPLDPEKLKLQDSMRKIIIAYDIEACQIEESPNKFRHEANLLIAHTCCSDCWDPAMRCRLDCEGCGPLERIYEGVDCVTEFCDYLINEVSALADKNSLVDIYAHNAKNYDSRFLLRELLKRQLKGHDLVMQGSKISKMTVGNLRFLDSCAFFQMKLSQLPHVFGFQDKVVKGHFPHLFNNGLNWDYVGPLPDLDQFGIEYMKKDDSVNLVSWHAAEKLDMLENQRQWVFKDEIIKYCRNDVEVLLLAIQEFRKEFVGITDIDPTTRCFTLPGIGQEVFRSKQLKKQALGVTPINSYQVTRDSLKCRAWLDAIEEEENIKIEREYKIGNFYADGYHRPSQTVYEFWGCYYHGCRCLFADPDAVINGLNRKVSEMRCKVEEKLAYYNRRNLNIIQLWEHHFEDLNDELPCLTGRYRKYILKSKNGNHCNIRDAFFGGRTGNTRMYYECRENERIRYVDFTSLYPWVLSTMAYPMGHPERLTKGWHSSIYSVDFKHVYEEKYFGFINCTIEPAENYKFGILPVRHNGKLTFPLCRACLESACQSECEHTSRDRALTGNWTTAEVYQALKEGYRMLEVHEILHYENQDDTMFKDYVRMWLKIKQEASGWPASVTQAADEEEREIEILKYLEAYEFKEGIRLDRESIVKNPGRRQIAKLMLNSFWGKFAQRPNLPRTKIIRDHHTFMELFNDRRYEIVGEHDTGLDCWIVNYVDAQEDKSDPGNTSVALAAFVTSYARLKLWDLMKQVEVVQGGDTISTLYYDTDSLIFVEDVTVSNETVPTGPFLGNLTDEIKQDYGEDAVCKRACFLGPKTYAYEVTLGNGDKKAVVKCKGITLYYSPLNKFSQFEDILQVAKNYGTADEEPVVFAQSGIRANVNTHLLSTVHFNKQIQARMDKRRLDLDTGISYEIGYREEVLNF